MAVGHPHVNDVHTIRLRVTSDGVRPVPLAGPVTIRLRKPNGVTMDVDGDLTTDGTDGLAEYVTLVTDLDRAGEWSAQLKDEDGPWHASVVTFTVLANL